jgi:hypothetical protein
MYPIIDLPIRLQEICGPILGHMNVEIRTEAAQFPEKEYINRIYVAVHRIVSLQISQDFLRKQLID